MINKKLLTRLFALLASLVLVLALALPCFADGVVGEESYCVKTITFIDRPSLWAWLLDNYNQVQKAVLSVSLSPVPITFGSVNVRYANDALTDVIFSDFYPIEVQQSQVKYSQIFFNISDDGTVALLGVKSITLQDVSSSQDGVSVVLSSDTATVLPDEYWSQLDVSLTVYYYAPLSQNSTPTDPTTPSSDMYTNLFNILKDAVYGSDAELTGSQEYALTLISTILTYATILLPVILVICIAVWCFKRF